MSMFNFGTELKTLITAYFFCVTKYTPVNIKIAEIIFTKVSSSFPKLMAKTVAKNGCKYTKTATVVGFNSRIESKFSI